jgi:hypothetical protein
MAVVPLGALAVALSMPGEAVGDPVTSSDGVTTTMVMSPPAFGFNHLPGLIYWTIASAVAYFLITVIARRQGYRSGIWVNRRPLVATGLAALVVALVAMLGRLAPGDLLIRGYLPLVAIAVAIVYWGIHENRPALWCFGLVVTALAVTANLYDMENLLARTGIPLSSAAGDVVNLGVMSAAFLLGAAGFALARASRPRHGTGTMR